MSHGSLLTMNKKHFENSTPIELPHTQGQFWEQRDFFENLKIVRFQFIFSKSCIEFNLFCKKFKFRVSFKNCYFKFKCQNQFYVEAINANFEINVYVDMIYSKTPADL